MHLHGARAAGRPAPGGARAAHSPAPFPRRTPHTVAGRAALDARLEDAKRNGFALVDQELELGLRSIAVPVRDGESRVIAALNAGTNALRRSAEDLKTQVMPRLREAAAQLGAEIGRASRAGQPE